MNATAFLILALAVAAKSTETTDKIPVLDVIKSGVEFFSNLDIEQRSNPSSRAVVIDNTENKNLIFKLVSKVISKLLETPIAVNNIKIGEILSVQNATISGLDSAWLKISSPSGGYTLNNFTILVPELLVEADSYTMSKLNLGVVVLDGTGKLRISIKNFSFTTKMSMHFADLKFVVDFLNVLAVNAESSDFELENLGNSSDEISGLLNGIAELALPKLVRAITNDLGDIIEAANSDCTESNLEAVCSIIGLIFTKLKDSL